MKLYLKGHSYQYAVEQMLLTVFPGERPLYPAGKPAGDRMEIRLHRAERYTTASCLLVRGGERCERAAYGNASDDGVEDYPYDYVFANDRPLDQTKGAFLSFLDGIVAEANG